MKAILKISIPRNKKEIQSFIWKINFLRWFIPNFAEIVKHLTKMIRKDQDVKWTPEAKLNFEKIKQALTEAPVLVRSNLSKDFITFYFASKDSIAAVLLLKNA